MRTELSFSFWALSATFLPCVSIAAVVEVVAMILTEKAPVRLRRQSGARGLAGTHVQRPLGKRDVDGRDRPGHDGYSFSRERIGRKKVRSPKGGVGSRPAEGGEG